MFAEMDPVDVELLAVPFDAVANSSISSNRSPRSLPFDDTSTARTDSLPKHLLGFNSAPRRRLSESEFTLLRFWPPEFPFSCLSSSSTTAFRIEWIRAESSRGLGSGRIERAY